MHAKLSHDARRFTFSINEISFQFLKRDSGNETVRGWVVGEIIKLKR